MKSMLYNNDCVKGLKSIDENVIDVCITDPPYNYEFIGHKWDFNEIQRRIKRIQNSNTLIKNIPYGSGLAGGVRNSNWYKNNATNINDYQEWTKLWGEQVYRVLKPGSFILVFNSTRTIAHVQVALEQVGFYARDIIVWRKNAGIPKGINLSSKLQKDGYDNPEKWEGWHSCLRNEWEAIALLQKPLENNYPNTVLKWGIGVLHVENEHGNFQSNIIHEIIREEKQKFNIHCTVKPTKLIMKLIELTVPIEDNRIVLDPFIGSGTTALAAIELGIKYLGYEIVPQYYEIAEQRISKYENEHKMKLL